jgi:putative methyltransferase (TIGR04325 family)
MAAGAWRPRATALDLRKGEQVHAHASAIGAVRDFLEGPLTRPALMQWRRRQFRAEEGFGSYFGLFDSFAAAREWLPRNPGFNLGALSAEYVDVRTKQVFEYDYPVMWWLQRALDAGARDILDIGGSVGVHYYAYRSYIDMPEALRWRVVEVPVMVAIGRQLAAEREDSRALSFTADLQEALAMHGIDIWITAGALQYMEDARPAQLLRRCAQMPAHMLLNRVPLYEGDDYVTAQNIGKGCFAPVQVLNRRRFIHGIEDLGYTLEDHWQVHERSLYLPGHPERSLPSFSGFYFAARARAVR